MTSLEGFARLVGLENSIELERVILLGFFHLKHDSIAEFDVETAASWLEALNFAKPNKTRLRKSMETSRFLVRGSSHGLFKLQRAKLSELEGTYPDLDTSETVHHTGAILPENLYRNSRGYLESLVHQINASYEYNIFDGCAVLMRRVMEVLLILSFEHLNIADEIKNADGTYVMLESIISKAKNHAKLSLSRNSRETLEVFRNLGNFSAHKIYYNCKRDDIKRQALAYRALFEELLYKSGIRV
jgi:hypothetical protein